MSAFGVHGCSIITALTAQNTQGVLSSEPVSQEMLRAQFHALEADLPPAVIKTGMLGSAGSVKIIADFLERFMGQDTRCKIHGDPDSCNPNPATPAMPVLVCDPVLKSTSGSDLLDPEALEILKSEIFPKVGILTPNLPEVGKLIGDFKTLEEAADKVLQLGVKSVLIKGGHSKGGQCTDFWTDGSECLELTSPRIDTRHTHGTGCILASAIASAIALGQSIPDAVKTGKDFIIQCLESPANVGSGHGPMIISPFENRPMNRP